MNVMKLNDCHYIRKYTMHMSRNEILVWHVLECKVREMQVQEAQRLFYFLQDNNERTTDALRHGESCMKS